MSSIIRIISIFYISFFIVACDNTAVYAPVIEISSIDPIPQKGTYKVQQDDTLYSIAWRYGLDYRYLSQINHLSKPYHIEPGQVILLQKRSTHSRIGSSILASVKTHTHLTYTNLKTRVQSLTQPLVKKTSLQEQNIERAPVAPVSTWLWPAQGPIVRPFVEFNKGINIGGEIGDPIYAAAAGVVVYSGDALKSYGNLIIIKHNSVFLSAYAHNSRIRVKEGDWVKKGEKIAEMGNSGSPRAMLHFEIRKGGKPVNPLSYLLRKCDNK